MTGACPGCGSEGGGSRVLAGDQCWCPDPGCPVVSFRTGDQPPERLLLPLDDDEYVTLLDVLRYGKENAVHSDGQIQIGQLQSKALRVHDQATNLRGGEAGGE